MKLIFALLAITFVSCKKDKDASLQKSLVKKWQHQSPNAFNIFNYAYDKGKIVSSNTGNTHTEYLYNNEQVIQNTYSQNGSLFMRETMDLDNNGHVFQRHNSRVEGVTYFTIRPDGLVESEVNVNPGSVYEEKYYYSSTGLLDSVYSFQNNTIKMITSYTGYDMSREYTIGNEQFGIAFMGIKFKHPPLKSKRYLLQFQTTTTYTFTYKYDEKGRIIEDKRVASDFDNYTDTYEYY